MSKDWIAVASAEHVRIGRQAGFMQVCHGKSAPLRRIRPEDRVIYYSPTETFGGKDRIQAFTAIGRVRDTQPYQFQMSSNFVPWRRDVLWFDSQAVSIKPLLHQLHFTRNNANWGYQLRFGLFAIDKDDGELIEAAMLGEKVSQIQFQFDLNEV